MSTSAKSNKKDKKYKITFTLGGAVLNYDVDDWFINNVGCVLFTDKDGLDHVFHGDYDIVEVPEVEVTPI